MTTPSTATSQRPAPAERRFSAPSIETALTTIAAAIADPELRRMFAQCLPNTLDTTVDHRTDADGRPDTFVITGDIPAMWLRDSTNQVWPYLPYAAKDGKLARLFVGLIHRQAACVRLDPYANAFNDGPLGGHWQSDRTAMLPELHERKYELDSLCAVLRLAHGYFTATSDLTPFDATWLVAYDQLIATLRIQQRGTAEDVPPAYTFQRLTEQASDTLLMQGIGHPARRCGLVKSHFRPSDDAAALPFPIAANAMAVVCLRNTATLLDALGEAARAAAGRALASEIDDAIRRHGVVDHPTAGRILAYEVDGFGSAYCMDDANIPSLLALPYLGWCDAGDPLYQRTRAFVLSGANPYFFQGRAGEGVGGPHVGMGMIWPMAVVMRALTSADDGEIRACLRQLRDTTAGTGWMHEAYHQDDPSNFTRPWFAWANTLFGELVLDLHARKPSLLKQPL